MHEWPLLLPKTFCWWMITQFCAITMMVRQGVFDLKLLVKFNLLLIVVFGLGLFVIAYQARSFLQEQAQAEVLRQAGLMAASALATRNYTDHYHAEQGFCRTPAVPSAPIPTSVGVAPMPPNTTCRCAAANGSLPP